MGKTHSRRRVIAFLAVSATALGLSACGGGGGGSDSADGDLYAAFDKIDQGMSYEQVRDIIGFDYNAGKDDFRGTRIDYKWESGKGSSQYTVLSVTLDNGRTSGKIVVGYKGNNSKFW
ncbi:MAG: hypothetical protein JNK17_08120 [Hydrogenophaga sp.]|jgi:hypothetical protein|nr:hypothetical protein [Hydrogenophaga sp.]